MSRCLHGRDRYDAVEELGSLVLSGAVVEVEVVVFEERLPVATGLSD